jgi:pteridine reductase
MTFAGKLVLVTGGARRVGQAICRELAQGGAQVAIHCHRAKAEAQALCDELGGGAFVLSADLGQTDAAHALLHAAQAQSASGRVDFLVNNAAGFARTPFVTMTEAMWDEQINLNLNAPRRLIQHALPCGLSAVVNIVDVAAWQPWSEYAAYAVAKAGLLHLSRILASELAPAVRVNAVAPGTVLFPSDYDEATKNQILKRIPLGRQGSPEDVARAVSYLLGEPYLTSVCLPVDGGQGLR